jgi:mRNA interferase MazF
MPNYSKNDIILVRYPFSDLSSSKVRPAVVVSTPHPSQDILIVPLTSRTESLLDGEFLLSDWSATGLKEQDFFKRRVMILALGKLYKEGKILSRIGAGITDVFFQGECPG